ncbi:hypothetical protein [Streptomyces sp. NPDC001537]
MSSGGLQRLTDDLPDEIRELVEALRMMFGSLNLSMRRYALHCHCDVSTVSRYLGGLQMPPWSFVEGLLTHVAEVRGEPATQETLTHLRGMHRKAMLAGSMKGKAQQLQMLLEQADEDARQSKAREHMTADMLQERQARIHELQVQLRAVEAARAVDREELAEHQQQQEALRDERDRLYAEVRTLRAQLTKAQAATALAEERCAQLERQLDAAEQEEEERADSRGQTQPRFAATAAGRDEEHKPSEAEPATAERKTAEGHVLDPGDSLKGPRGPMVREYVLTGAFRRPSAQVASVLHYHNGGHSVVLPSGEHHSNRPFLARAYAVTEVLLGVHMSSLRMLLPAAGGSDFFSVEVDVQWQVVDPYTVVQVQLLDVEQMLAPEVQDRLRAVSMHFPLEQAQDAWQAMRKALQDDLASHLGLNTRAFVRVDLDRVQIRRQAQRYQALLQKGDTEALAYMMARSPSDATSILALLQAEQRAANKERTDLLRLFLDRGLLSREDISEQARTVLAFLYDSKHRAEEVDGRLILPPAPAPAPLPSDAQGSAAESVELGETHQPDRDSVPHAASATRAERQVRLWCDETQRIFGPDHRSSLSARHDWAGRVGAAGDPVKAADLYRALARDYTRIHGAHHRGALAAQREQARWTREAGGRAEAAKLYAYLAQHYRTVLGPDHRLTRTTETVLRELQARPTTR